MVHASDTISLFCFLSIFFFFILFVSGEFCFFCLVVYKMDGPRRLLIGSMHLILVVIFSYFFCPDRSRQAVINRVYSYVINIF